MENAPPTVIRLEDFFDHILRIQTASALRGSLEVPFTVESMLDAILHLLCLDFVHIKLNSITPIEMTRLATFGHQESLLPAFRQLLESLPAVNEAIHPVVLPNPVGEGDVTIVSCRLGLLPGIGVIVAGSQRADFPTRTEKLLLRVATNQAATVLQDAQRLNEQRRSKEDTERQVAAVKDDFNKEVTEHRLTEEALNLSEERFRRYFDLGLVGMAITSPEKGILEVNDELCRILGYERRELLQTSWPELTHPDDLAADDAQFARVIAGEVDGYSLDKRWICKDGRVIDSIMAAKCVRRAGGSVEYLVGLVQDITERKRGLEALKNSEERFRLLLEGIKDYAIVMLDPTGRVVTWNKGGERIRGYSPEEIIGRHFSCFYDPADIQLNKPEQALKLAAATGRFEDEGWRIHRDGSRFWANVVIAALRGDQGELEGFVKVTRDMTESHNARVALEKAYQEVKELKDKVTNEKRYLEGEIRTERGFEEIVGQSQALHAVLRQIQKVAPTDTTVLIQGETGTGKELIARAIHNLSKRRDKTFVKVNCAAIPTGLLESELFGCERGAFTGATTQKPGRFELAHQGTIFLDEVGEIPLELQVKLLRVLQEHEFERLGSGRTQRVDIRVVAATNRDLAQMVLEKTFRSDLYYRLHVFPVTAPALRERSEDISSLVRFFMKKYASQLNKPIGGMSEGMMNALCEYAWPGNIRELENVIERAAILASGDALELDWPLPEPQLAVPSRPQATTLEDAERNHIRRVLAECQWVISGPSGAAKKLGLKRTSLQYKMQKLGIVRPLSDQR